MYNMHNYPYAYFKFSHKERSHRRAAATATATGRCDRRLSQPRLTYHDLTKHYVTHAEC